jgi:signal transduction histidine kinase
MYAADYLVHFSNILLLVAYSVRDILWLRWFAVAAALTNIPYFLVQADILWPPVLWATVFTAINLYQIAVIYMQRRPVVLSADEQKLYDLAFRVLRPREFLSLTLAGEWRDATAGQKILTEGQAATEICIPIAGTVEVRRHGAPVGTVAPGQLVGTGVVLTGNPSPVDAAFSAPARYFAWPLNTLRSFLDKRPDLRTTLLQLANRDLADKLERVMATR